MEGESIEDGQQHGLLHTSLLGKYGSSRSATSSKSSNSTTAVLYFSTFIAVCGSYVFGASVSTLQLEVTFLYV